MTQSRQSQLSLSYTHYYYCISPCVPRTYLWAENIEQTSKLARDKAY
ncbi:hypothetical protein [uncultured Psychromonas sp.]|nr:hypothetical protein [uncultured Psychromonas sp.]